MSLNYNAKCPRHQHEKTDTNSPTEIGEDGGIPVGRGSSGSRGRIALPNGGGGVHMRIDGDSRVSDLLCLAIGEYHCSFPFLEVNQVSFGVFVVAYGSCKVS